MHRTRIEYLAAMGIETWLARVPEEACEGEVQPAPLASADAAQQSRRPAPSTPAARSDTGQLSWEALAERVAQCRLCALCETRIQTVFGVGDRGARWMIVGEAPGADEDRQGEPFVGRAGQLLNSMLRAAGFARHEVYIANVLKCRPPRNRDPSPEEIEQCRPYLDRQIELIAPRLILAVGRIAGQQLLDSRAPVGRLRGKVHRYGIRNIPLVVTYHPAYLLRSPLEKRKAWDDLQLALAAGGESPQ
jgi:DNA polymerase